MMKLVLPIALGLTIFLCMNLMVNSNTSKVEPIKVNEVVTESGEAEDGHYVNIKSFPVGSTNVVYLGNRWTSFELNGECFMYKASVHNGYLAGMECRED